MARAIGDYTPPIVERGRLTNYRTLAYVEFLYNPKSLHVSKGSNLVEDATPGFAHPMIAWASGKTRTISFTLELDGEATRRRRGSPFVNVVDNLATDASQDNILTIRGELAFYEQFQYPVDPSLQGSDGAADRVLLKLGPRYPGVLCAVETVDITETMWTPELEPTKADVHLVLKQISAGQVFAHQIWQGGGTK